MIQDIAPHQFRNEFHNRPLDEDSYLFYFQDGRILLYDSEEDGHIHIPKVRDYPENQKELEKHTRYLFCIDHRNYFLVQGMELKKNGRWQFLDVRRIREKAPMWKVFACSAGAQLDRWYRGNRFCGCCGHEMEQSSKERALCCPECKRIVYPSLAPAVIVGVTDKNRLLLTKYAGRAYKNYALVAGYAEFGESLEETVRREVKEEVGLNVGQIRYYKSQPWPFTDTLLVGYFAEIKGTDEIVLEEEELAEGIWFSRESLPETDSSLSLTNEMIEYFRKMPEIKE